MNHLRQSLLAVALAILLLPTLTAFAQSEPQPIGPDDRQAIISQVSEGLIATYIFLEDAEAMKQKLSDQLAAGAYDELNDAFAFCQRLTDDLHSVRRDLHLRVRVAPPRAADPSSEEAAAFEQKMLDVQRRGNYGFAKLEILPGNVGYLRLDGFIGAEHGGATAVAAMNFLSNADALIFDLRFNGGGEPSMIQLLSSYLFEEPTHLNSFYIRESDETQQFWTQAHVEGPRQTEVPVFVLTSGRTFSAAEEFTYNLKNLERATIVGETTGGGAHPVTGFQIEGYPISMSLPYGRAVNPVTGTNWEGTGITPHIEVSAGEALERAHLEALTKIAENAEDADHQERLAWVSEELEAGVEPMFLTSEQLAVYAGSYGPRTIRVEDGALLYTRGGGQGRVMVALATDRFMLAEMSGFRLTFERDADGSVVAIVGHYGGGRTDRHERDSEF